MLLIYTPNITARLQYIMQYVFEEKLGLEFLITDDKQKYISNNIDLKIIYDKENFENGFFFHAHDLLLENDIKERELFVSNYNNLPILFASKNDNAALPFDVFSAIFY